MVRRFVAGLKAWLFPQEHRFFQLFEEQARIAEEAAEALVRLFAEPGKAGQLRDAIKALELKGDDNVKVVYVLVNTNFITPLDQEDIIKLTHSLDDITDYIFAVTNRFCLYDMRAAGPEMKHFSAIIVRQTSLLKEAMARLRHMTPEESGKLYAEVKSLEKQGDDLLNRAVGALLKGKDAVAIIKRKELYEYLELVTDKCFAVGCLVLDISLKYS